MKHTYKLEGLDCTNCAAKLEKAINEIKEVTNVEINMVKQTIDFELDDLTKIKDIVNIASKKDVYMYDERENRSDKKKFSLLDDNFMIFRMIITAILVLGSYLVDENLKNPLLLASYFIIAYDIIYFAVKRILRRELLDEFFLMTIASIGAIIINEIVEGVAVVLFYQLGEYFNRKAINSSRKSISDLMNLKVSYANLIKDGKTMKVDPKFLKVGDRILLKNGEMLAVDGHVLEGEGIIDRSRLTGESLAENVSKDDKLLAGIVNLEDALTVYVEKEYKDSTVKRILDLIENASQNKSKSERYITRFARVYTPIVVTLAFLFFIIAYAITGDFTTYFYRSLAFLVVSCPCALVLSVPLSYFSGIANLSKNKVLVKGSNYLENMTKIKKIIFDKTGTLTKGDFKVESITLYDNSYTEDEAMKILAHLESGSNHPLAKAIIKAFNKEIDTSLLTEIKEIKGKGISAKFNDQLYLAGNLRMLEEYNIDFVSEDTLTTIFLASNDKIIAKVLLSDVIKEEAENVIKQLKLQGIETIMLTGDKRKNAEITRKKLSLDGFHAELLPEDKLRILEKEIEQTEGYVGFVGDGINDAPSLGLADISFSMGEIGSDAAVEASDIVVMNDSLEGITKSIQIAGRTNTIVKQNIGLSLGIKAIALLLVGVGYAPLWLAIFSDVGVSLIVVLNAMRLLK